MDKVTDQSCLIDFEQMSNTELAHWAVVHESPQARKHLVDRHTNKRTTNQTKG